MTTSPPSNSSGTYSNAFQLLDQRIQKWIWSEGWEELRDAQEHAIGAILGGDRDVIIAAATASGKTEAAFLPILTKLLQHEAGIGVVLYISPLKALINDQWSRLDKLCASLDIPVVPWHGDISETKKHRFLKSPSGVLLITPESLESLFANRGHGIAGIFKRLQFVVVDELHAFIGTERGKQLQSLMQRVDVALGHPIRRVALSATLGDMQLAADFLRPRTGSDDKGVQVIESAESGGELKLLVKGYRSVAPKLDDKSVEALIKQGRDPELEDTIDGGYLSIAQHLFQVLRGANNLVFPNSRRNVELYADLLRRKCEQLKVPNEFWPHHGSLSKEIREEAEAALKKGERPSSAICTTTLELGIDIGAVKSIAQIGCPPSVASLRQRLGRSGRRGEAAILRVYALESKIEPNSPLNDRLRVELVQIVAMIGLLLQGWYEPPRINGLHLSTLVQQVLSIIAQRGGATAGQLWQMLCEGGPFSRVTKEQLVLLLRQLGEKEFLMQQDDGLLLHGVVGERVVNHYGFYASFVTDEEFRVMTGGRVLGTLPVSRPIAPDSFIIFAGRRWKVRTIDQEHKVIDVIPAGGGKPPLFDGGGGMVHDRIREEMLAIYQGDDTPSFLDATALELLNEGRHEFAELEINGVSIFDSGKDVLLFVWKGDWIQDTLALMLKSEGLSAINEGVAVRVYNVTREEVDKALRHLVDNPPQASELANFSFNKYREKWDGLLPDELINENYAAAYLDVTGVLSVIETLI